MKKLLIVLLSALVLSGCPELGRHWNDQTETLLVDYYKVQCDEDGTALCFRIREDSSDSWETAPEDFSGFSSFEWGYRYEVTVVTTFDDDGDPESYDFSSVNSSEAVTADDESFSLTLYTDTGILAQLDDSSWSIDGDISFDCSSYCSDILTAVNSGYVLQLEFTAEANVLTLTAYVCSASEDDFDSECEGESEDTWYIGHFQTDCGLAVAQMCLVYKANSSDEYELLQLADGIENFSPEWGYRYHIDVTKTVSNGGNITEVELEEDDDDPDERIGSSYTFMFVVRGSAMSESSSNYLDLYDSSENLDCGSYSLCSKIDDYIDDDQFMLLKGYVDTSDVVITKVVCHKDSYSSFVSCVEDEDEDEDINWSI